MIPIQPIKDLTQTKENKIIKLKWSKPTLNISKKPVAYIRGYKIYRKVPGKKAFDVLNQEDVLQEYYEDSDTGLDGDYSYYVTSIYSQDIQSDPSNTVSVAVKDVFPPDPPANLVAFKAEDSIFLTWESVKDRDFSFYRIFRRSTPRGEFKLFVEKVTNNYFKDKNVKRGILYSYYVTAVDNKGNESKNSNTVKEEF
jgi:fibronectin type 3 domain-containing protein